MGTGEEPSITDGLSHHFSSIFYNLLMTPPLASVWSGEAHKRWLKNTTHTITSVSKYYFKHKVPEAGFASTHGIINN